MAAYAGERELGFGAKAVPSFVLQPNKLSISVSTDLRFDPLPRPYWPSLHCVYRVAESNSGLVCGGYGEAYDAAVNTKALIPYMVDIFSLGADIFENRSGQSNKLDAMQEVMGDCRE